MAKRINRVDEYQRERAIKLIASWHAEGAAEDSYSGRIASFESIFINGFKGYNTFSDRQLLSELKDMCEYDAEDFDPEEASEDVVEVIREFEAQLTIYRQLSKKKK